MPSRLLEKSDVSIRIGLSIREIDFVVIDCFKRICCFIDFVVWIIRWLTPQAPHGSFLECRIQITGIQIEYCTICTTYVLLKNK